MFGRHHDNTRRKKNVTEPRSSGKHGDATMLQLRLATSGEVLSAAIGREPCRVPEPHRCLHSKLVFEGTQRRSGVVGPVTPSAAGETILHAAQEPLLARHTEKQASNTVVQATQPDVTKTASKPKNRTTQSNHRQVANKQTNKLPDRQKNKQTSKTDRQTRQAKLANVKQVNKPLNNKYTTKQRNKQIKTGNKTKANKQTDRQTNKLTK